MFQLNVMLKIGDRTHDNHPFCGWGRYHTEFFTCAKALRQRQLWWADQGITAEYGELTQKVNGNA